VDTDEALAEKRIGTWLGAWKLERLLGIGGMASVFVGRRGDGVVAAVKLLHPYYSEYRDVRQRFLREGPIGSALAAVGPLCQGLPNVFESGETPDGSVYLAMELLEGETLFDRLVREGAMPVGQALWIAQQVLDVLVIAHEHEIIHRDLKPENVFLVTGGGVKVLDFGVARVATALPDGGFLPDNTRTKTGSIVGSARYMSPEQALGRVSEIDARSDIFGLGATLFHALSGRTLHMEISDGSALIAAATKDAPPLESVAAHVPPALCAVVDRAVRRNKAERYPDARTMRREVAAIRAGR
jgi:serine/threonine-protein kinase